MKKARTKLELLELPNGFAQAVLGLAGERSVLLAASSAKPPPARSPMVVYSQDGASLTRLTTFPAAVVAAAEDLIVAGDGERIALVVRQRAGGPVELWITRDLTDWQRCEAPPLPEAGQLMMAALEARRDRLLVVLYPAQNLTRSGGIFELEWSTPEPAWRSYGSPTKSLDHPSAGQHYEGARVAASVSAIAALSGRTFVHLGATSMYGIKGYSHFSEILPDGARRFVAHVAEGAGVFALDGSCFGLHDVRDKKLFLHDLRGEPRVEVPLSKKELANHKVIGIRRGHVWLTHRYENKTVHLAISDWPEPSALPDPQPPLPASRPKRGRVGFIGGPELAPACPEPIGYDPGGHPGDVRFDAVVGWSLDDDPESTPPSVDVVGLTEAIVGFYRVTLDDRLRLAFNFVLDVIERVDVTPALTPTAREQAARIVVTTPTGRTTFFASEELGRELARRAERKPSLSSGN